MQISPLPSQIPVLPHGTAAFVRRPQDNETKTEEGEGPDELPDGVEHATSAENDQIEVRTQLQQLADRDREVRAHEMAHKAVAGPYAGAMSLDYVRGPDGQMYAVGGEVAIDLSPIPDDPAATQRKAETIQKAAMAPANPSSQDFRVAAKAAAMAAHARIEQTRDQADMGRAGDVSPADVSQRSKEALAAYRDGEESGSEASDGPAEPEAAGARLLNLST